MGKNVVYLAVSATLGALYVYWQEPSHFCFTQECLLNTVKHLAPIVIGTLLGLNSQKPGQIKG